MPDYSASRDPELQPFRDSSGNVVTLTPDQCAAIARALQIWLKVAPDSPSNQFLREAVTQGQAALSRIHMKSCLLGRILYDGRPPLVDAPPVYGGAPNYNVEVYPANTRVHQHRLIRGSLMTCPRCEEGVVSVYCGVHGYCCPSCFVKVEVN